MALDLGTLSLKVTADLSPAEASLRRLPQSAEQAGRKAGDGVNRGMSPGLAKLSGLFKGLGIFALGAGLLDYVRQAGAASDATDKFRQTLKFAGLGSTEIAAATKATKRYADQTVYDLADVQNTAAQLAANGIVNYRQLTEAAGNLNAVAGGNKDTFRAVALVLTQTAGAGKLTTENWNQLSDAIPGASGQLQNAMRKNGAFTGNFRTAMEKGQISAAEFNKALLLLGNKPVAVNAAKSTKTFEGALGNLQATLVGGLADALATVKPMLTEGMSALANALPGVLGMLQSLGGWIADNKVLLSYLGKGFLIAAAAVGVWTAAQWLLNSALIANPIGLVVIALAALVAGFLWCYDNVSWFRDGVNAAFKGIGDVARWLWNNALAPALRGIVAGFGWVLDGIANLMDALGGIPGFEWARGAAVHLRQMAEGARQAGRDIADIPEPVVETSESQKQVEELDKKIRDIKGKIVEAKAKGDTKEVDKLQTKLDKLKDKKVKIQADVKKTGVTTIKMVNAGGGLKISAYAAGGRFIPGWALVGEQGPELVKFSGSGNVYTAAQTRRLIAASHGNRAQDRAPIQFNISNHYPQAEPTSTTTNRALEYAAAVGVN